jgi:hypothetical protein
VNNYGIEDAYIHFYQPLLEKSRILWQTGSLSRAQEQFVRNTVRQILTIEDYNLKVPLLRSKSCVAMINTSDYMSDNNFLFYKYLLKKDFDVILQEESFLLLKLLRYIRLNISNTYCQFCRLRLCQKENQLLQQHPEIPCL